MNNDQNEIKAVLEMTASTIGRDMLQALVQEIKLLPDVWPKMSEAKQNDVIDRLRNRVEHNVKLAVHMIASEGRTVVANPSVHTNGMDEVRGESDQRAMDLGREYDPNGDGKGMDDGNVVDGQILEVEHQPLQEELQAAFDAGYVAATDGLEQSDCPVMPGALCIQWVKGWKSWHKENNTDWWQANGDDDSDSK